MVHTQRRPLRLLATCIALSLLRARTKRKTLAAAGKVSRTAGGPGLAIVFHIQQVGILGWAYSTCPSQSAYNLSITAIEFPSANSVVIELPIDAEFRGVDYEQR